MDRLLSPNEAKFWLMDYTTPMNSVVVVQTRKRLDAADFARGSDFALPTIVLGRNRRPRWSHRPEDAVPGVLEQVTGDDMHWLVVAADLMEAPTGTAGHPNWRATVVRHDEGGGSTLVMAMNHALTDYRSSLWVADQFIAGRFPGEMTPACEESLPGLAYGDPTAADLIEAWWTSRAGERWEAAGIDRLTAALPPASRARLGCVRFSAEETALFRARCEAEGVTLNGAVAVALRDAVEARTVTHSVDMHRFIRPALPPAPGIAISHIYTDVPDRGSVPDFWEAAREVRSAVFDQIWAGAHGDALLILPKVLLRGELDLTTRVADLTITGSPTYRAPGMADPDPDTLMELVLSSARGGGDIVLLSHYQDRLQLLSSCPDAPPTGHRRLDLEAVADRLRTATGMASP